MKVYPAVSPKDKEVFWTFKLNVYSISNYF